MPVAPRRSTWTAATMTAPARPAPGPETGRPSWCQLQTGTYLTPGTWLTSPHHYAQCRSDFVLESSIEFYGTVYAPNSTIEARNSAKIWGGVAGDVIRFYNSVEFHLTAGA